MSAEQRTRAALEWAIHETAMSARVSLGYTKKRGGVAV